MYVPAHICPGIYWSAAMKDVSLHIKGKNMKKVQLTIFEIYSIYQFKFINLLPIPT